MNLLLQHNTQASVLSTHIWEDDKCTQMFPVNSMEHGPSEVNKEK